MLIYKIKTWHPGRLARNTFNTTAGLVLRSGFQALVFLIIARSLGVNGYGAFISVVALAGGLGSFTGLGANMLLVRDGARGKESFPNVWGRSIVTFIFSIPLVTLLFTAITYFFLPKAVNSLAVFLVGLSELIFVPLIDLCGRAYQAHERLFRASQLSVIMVAVRLAGACIFYFLSRERHTVLVWASFHLGASLFAASFSIVMIRRDFLTTWKPVLSSGSILQHICEGLPFSLGGATLRLYSDIDKFMLAGLSSLETTGIYSAAYRVMGVAVLPLRALIEASLPRFFKAGEYGVAQGLKYATRLLPLPFLYALGASMALFCAAPIVPYLIGTEFGQSSTALRWLTAVPILYIIRYFLQTVLASSGHQQFALSIILISTITNICLNFIFIPTLNWLGAIVALYVTEGTMIGLFSSFFLVSYLYSKFNKEKFKYTTLS